MSGDSKKETDGSIAGDVPQATDNERIKNKKKKNGVFSRLFNGIFRSHGSDFEKRLEYLSKQEAVILSRMRRRSHRFRGTIKNLVLLALALEVVAIGFAIMTTRSLNLSWQMRAMRVLPMFLLPVLAFLMYTAFEKFTRMSVMEQLFGLPFPFSKRKGGFPLNGKPSYALLAIVFTGDRWDENNLEKLRAERQEKIDELKERTNYYTTQQLIQRYDTDPAAKAAAASVLASKLGADSGMRVFLGEESMLSTSTGKSGDVELVQPGGLRNRKQSIHRANSVDSTIFDHPNSDMLQTIDDLEGHGHHPMVVDHFQPTGSTPHDGSWISRLAALLVGEDPTQSYALICGNCHIHNGLARKEDFPYTTYYCPHCKVLNRPKQQDEHISASTNPVTSPSSVSGIAGSFAVMDKDSKSSVVDTVSTDSLVDGAGESITSLSSAAGAATNVTNIDKDEKGSVVDALSTKSPVDVASENITSLSSVAGAATNVADIDKDGKGLAVDALATDNPVDVAGESIKSLSSVAGAATRVAGIDKDEKGSAVDTISTDSPVTATDELNTTIESVSPQDPSSS